MRKFSLIFIAIVVCFSAAGAQSKLDSYYDIAAQPGTWILKEGGLPRQGLFIAAGEHRNTFNPCNTSDYIAVSIKDLTPNPDPCRAPGAAPPNLRPHPIPYGVLNSKPFYSSIYTIDAQAFNRVLAMPDGYKAKKLIDKVNSGEIMTIGDLKKDATFSKLVVKKSTITPL
jgi:hypothetical protein